MKHFTIALFAVLLAACNTQPQEPELSENDVVLDRLHRVTNSDADLAYVDPDADFGRFNRIMVDPLAVDKVEIIEPDMRASASVRARGANWELTDEDKQRLQEAFADAMRIQLEEKGDYPIVTEAGDDVLRISAVLTALAPNAPPDDFQSRSIGRSRVYTEGAGTVFITVGFADSVTGEVLGLVKDSRATPNNWGVNNSVSNLADVRFIFSSWARGIRARLDLIHGH